MAKKTYVPITAVCKACGREFIISPEEQKHFYSMGFALPKRCAECRKRRKEERNKAEKEEQERRAAKEARERQKKWEEDERKLNELLRTSAFRQTTVPELKLTDPEKSLVIIGNGFDIMHGVKSSYWDFQKTIGKDSVLRFEMETYLETGDLWYNLEEALGKLNYSMFLNPDIIDMWLDDFGAYDPDAQAADFFGAVETAIEPTFNIPRELNRRFRKWVQTLTAESKERPFAFLRGDYKVLCFNYTEFIETLYGAKQENVCYIHGSRKKKKGKPDALILGHRPGMEQEQWDRVKLRPFRYKDSYKRYIMESALETASREAAWYDESTTKDCHEIIRKHEDFFDGMSEITEVYVIGHSLAAVDYPYFENVRKSCDAKWFIGYHSYDDMERLYSIVDKLDLKEVTIFRT